MTRLILDIMDLLMTQEADGIVKRMLDLMLENTGSWAFTSKMCAIFHRNLRDPKTCDRVARQLKQRENMLVPFQRKAGDTSYESEKYAELSGLYINYLKYLFNVKL